MENEYFNSDVCLHHDELQNFELSDAINCYFKDEATQVQLELIFDYMKKYVSCYCSKIENPSPIYQDILTCVDKPFSKETFDSIVSKSQSLNINLF